MIHELVPEQPYVAEILAQHPHGLIAGARYTDEPIPLSILRQLHRCEQDDAYRLGPARTNSFVAGRLALRLALSTLGLDPRVSPIPRGPTGAPKLPWGFAGSITHEAHIALAIASVDASQSIGIDIGQIRPVSSATANRILTSLEAEAIAKLEIKAYRTEVAVRFAVKEAIHKALGSFTDTIEVGFKELTVVTASPARLASGFDSARVMITSTACQNNASQVALEASYTRSEDLVIATAAAW